MLSAFKASIRKTGYNVKPLHSHQQKLRFSTKDSKNEPERFSVNWWKHTGIVFLVFGITGSTTVSIVKPALSTLNITGTFAEGPWSYRLSYLAVTLPLYSTILVTVGTIFGKGAYFRNITYRMYGRILPKWMMEKLK